MAPAAADVAVVVDEKPNSESAAQAKSCRIVPFKDMKDDLVRRLPHYCSDWTSGFNPKVLASSLFMYFTSIAPAITFAAVMDASTKVCKSPLRRGPG